MSTSGLKAIAPVPTAADFLDIVLSKTQRKTPTVRSLIVRVLTPRPTPILGHPQKLQDQSHSQLLHAQGQIHTRFI